MYVRVKIKILRVVQIIIIIMIIINIIYIKLTRDRIIISV